MKLDCGVGEGREREREREGQGGRQGETDRVRQETDRKADDVNKLSAYPSLLLTRAGRGETGEMK